VEVVKADGKATVRASGTGASTFLHQAARLLGRPVIVVDLAALPDPSEAEALQRVIQDRPGGGGPRPDRWPAALDAWAPGAVPAFDGHDPVLHRWVADLHLDRPWLSAGEMGDVALDPISPEVAASFLERRLRGLRMTWTPAALREAVDLAAGDPALLQRLGSGAMRSGLEQARRRIAVDDLLEAALAPPGLLPKGAEGPGGPRRGLLLAMARDPRGTPTLWANRAGLEPKAAVVHLRRLRDEGLVERGGRGEYRIASPLLGLRLQARMAAPVRLVPGPRS
jgi:DNA-binding transcriptional ArsR family regulator